MSARPEGRPRHRGHRDFSRIRGRCPDRIPEQGPRTPRRASPAPGPPPVTTEEGPSRAGDDQRGPHPGRPSTHAGPGHHGPRSAPSRCRARPGRRAGCRRGARPSPGRLGRAGHDRRGARSGSLSRGGLRTAACGPAVERTVLPARPRRVDPRHRSAREGVALRPHRPRPRRGLAGTLAQAHPGDVRGRGPDNGAGSPRGRVGRHDAGRAAGEAGRDARPGTRGPDHPHPPRSGRRRP